MNLCFVPVPPLFRHYGANSFPTWSRPSCSPRVLRIAPAAELTLPRSMRNLAVLATALSINLPLPARAAPTVPSHTSVAVHHITRSTRPSSISKPLHVRASIATVSPTSALQVSLKDRLVFYLGEFLMWNPAAKVLALFAFTLTAMYVGSFFYRFADPSMKEAKYPFWHAVRAIANPLEDDWERNSLRTASIVLAGIGMVVFAILVGMVTESVESAVRNVDGQMAKVVVSDHIVVCGWSPHVSQMLKDVGSVQKKVKVVVLARAELKERMMQHLRETLSDEERKGLRVFYRAGAPIFKNDLERVGASRASKIILVNSRDGDLVDADRTVLTRAMALRQNLPDFQGDIVAELNDVRDESLLRTILGETMAKSVESVNAESLFSRFMAQAIRQPGLADVVSCMMGDDPKSVFHVRSVEELAPELIGTMMINLKPSSVPGSILCGVCGEDGEIRIGLGARREEVQGRVRADTKLLVLGFGGTGDKFGGSMGKGSFVQRSLTEGSSKKQNNRSFRSRKKEAESFLLCGWRDEMNDMLAELDDVLVSGSKVTIVDEDAPAELRRKLKNLEVTSIQRRANDYETLEALLSPKTSAYDHVVLLGSGLHSWAEMNGQNVNQEKDSKTLASLVYINELLSKQQEAQRGSRYATETVITVEFANEQIATMAKEQGIVRNAMLPLNLSAKIAAQTVRDSRLNAVWKELLSQRGREVYLRKCAMYKSVTAGGMKSFTEVADGVAGEKGRDVVVGFVEKDGRVVLNPGEEDREMKRVWDTEDLLIVLSNE